MKKLLCIAVLVLAVVVLVWALQDSTPQTPLAARVLYRTNDPIGQMRYVIVVTNLSNDLLFVQPSWKSFTNRIWSPTQSVPFVLFDAFDLRSHSTRVFAAAPRRGAAEPPALWYQRYSTWPQWAQWPGFWIRSLLHQPRPASRTPQKLFIDVPAE